jgi:hypothetical protein
MTPILFHQSGHFQEKHAPAFLQEFFNNEPVVYRISYLSNAGLSIPHCTQFLSVTVLSMHSASVESASLTANRCYITMLRVVSDWIGFHITIPSRVYEVHSETLY